MANEKPIYDTLRACFIGDDGEVHQAGLDFIAWLRDICNYGDSPLDEQHYNGDLILHGRVLGRQEVFNRFIEAMSIPPETVRQEHIETVMREAREEGEYGDG